MRRRWPTPVITSIRRKVSWFALVVVLSLRIGAGPDCTVRLQTHSRQRTRIGQPTLTIREFAYRTPVPDGYTRTIQSVHSGRRLHSEGNQAHQVRRLQSGQSPRRTRTVLVWSLCGAAVDD